MGQNQPKTIYNQSIFLQYYHQHTTNDYLSSNKTYGLKNSIVQAKRQDIIYQNQQEPLLPSENGQKESLRMNKKILMPSVYPYSCVGLLIMQFKSGIVYRNGFLIGSNLVMTAASNIYDKQNMEMAEKIYFALNVIDNKGDMFSVKRYYYHDNFIKEAEGSHRYNYALLEIEPKITQSSSQTTTGQQVDTVLPGLAYGYLGINTTFKGQQNIYVYAFSRDTANQNQNNHLQFYLRGAKIDKLIAKSGCISYRMQTCENETGSPILVRRGQYYLVVGIHIGGKKELSSGIQFNTSMRQAVNSWVQCIKGEICLSGKSMNFQGIGLLISFRWNYMMIINLDNNNLTNESLIILTKVRWPLLRELYLCENKLQRLDFDADSIINLENFFLHKNQLKQISILSQLPILHVLDLADNRIDNIDPLFTNKSLERLYLNCNKITRIPTDIHKLSRIKKLYIEKNEIETIPDEIIRLKQLVTISLDEKAMKGKENISAEWSKNKVEVIYNE